MQRDQRGLHPKPENQQDEGHLQRHLVLVDLLQQIAGGLETGVPARPCSSPTPISTSVPPPTV